MLSHYTTFLANRLCGGSSRKLIAGWWYSILTLTALLTILSFAMVGRRSAAECFTSFWSALLLCGLSIGGTMIMRKFHNSMAVGFFMGSVVCTSQLFFLLFFLYIGFGKDQRYHNSPIQEEAGLAMLALFQCLFLATFAAILAAHRSEILDRPANAVMDMMDEMHGIGQHNTTNTNKHQPLQSGGTGTDDHDIDETNNHGAMVEPRNSTSIRGGNTTTATGTAPMMHKTTSMNNTGRSKSSSTTNMNRRTISTPLTSTHGAAANDDDPMDENHPTSYEAPKISSMIGRV